MPEPFDPCPCSQSEELSLNSEVPVKEFLDVCSKPSKSIHRGGWVSPPMTCSSLSRALSLLSHIFFKTNLWLLLCSKTREEWLKQNCHTQKSKISNFLSFMKKFAKHPMMQALLLSTLWVRGYDFVFE